jgi:pyruvate kinase
MPFISDKDYEDIKFACRSKVDFIALSFVRRKEDVLAVRKILSEENSENIELIAKIENQEGVDNLDEILEVVDGIMVARGDLGVEVSTQLVPIYQKKIIQKANEVGKPVITATHMLESMMSSPRPTRAEASDVANAILDGSDAIMLSGETAVGEYPIESVLTMDTIAKAIEDIIPYEDRLAKAIRSSHSTTNDAIGIAVSQTVITLPKAEVIIAFTETGGTAKRMCKFRPGVPIIAITDSVETCQRLSYYWGVFATIGDNVTDLRYHDKVAIQVAKDFGFKVGATLVITSGWGQKHGSTNTMRIIDIEE